MVRIVSVDRTKASPLCASFDGAQSDPSRPEGEAGGAAGQSARPGCCQGREAWGCAGGRPRRGQRVALEDESRRPLSALRSVGRASSGQTTDHRGLLGSVTEGTPPARAVGTLGPRAGPGVSRIPVGARAVDGHNTVPPGEPPRRADGRGPAACHWPCRCPPQAPPPAASGPRAASPWCPTRWCTPAGPAGPGPCCSCPGCSGRS